MDSAADRKSVRAKEKRSRQAQRLREEVITDVMSTAAGREWIWDLLSSCHCFATTFNGDALQSAYNEGTRAAGLRLLSDIMVACPDAYIQAMREANERYNRDDASPADERRRGEEPDGGDSGSVDADVATDENGRFYEVGGFNDPNRPINDIN